MKAVTAKVFDSGNFQTIRLPKDIRVKSSTVKLSKTAAGFIVSEVNRNQPFKGNSFPCQLPIESVSLRRANMD